MSDNMIFLSETLFGQFFMLNKMAPTFSVHLGVHLAKILVAMATDILKIAILFNFGCHGNRIERIEHVHHDHSTYKI